MIVHNVHTIIQDVVTGMLILSESCQCNAKFGSGVNVQTLLAVIGHDFWTLSSPLASVLPAVQTS